MLVEEGRKVMVMMWSWCQGGAGLVDKGAGVGICWGRRGRRRGRRSGGGKET